MPVMLRDANTINAILTIRSILTYCMHILQLCKLENYFGSRQLYLTT